MRQRELFPSRRDIVWISVLCLGLGLLSFSYRGLDDLARNAHGHMPTRFIEELSSATSAAVLLPFLIWFARCFPVSRAAVWRRLGLHLAGAVAWSGVLT